MSGETKASISGWSVDTLKEFFDRRIDELEKRVESRIDGNDTRYEQRFLAQEAANKYAQEKANEFRGSLDDVGKKQMPRTEAEAIFRAITEKAELGTSANSAKIDALQARLDRTEGRSGGLTSGWGYLVGAIGLAATLIMIFLALKK